MMPEWSSPRPISRAESSIPALCTPRISPTFRVIPVPGMNAPGAAKTAFMPVWAFGAPQTTDTMPSPVSTLQARRRSAFGCCTASITCAIRKEASAAPRFSTPSSSRPICVSVSVIRSSEASVSQVRLQPGEGEFHLAGASSFVAAAASRASGVTRRGSEYRRGGAYFGWAGQFSSSQCSAFPSSLFRRRVRKWPG